MVNYHYFTPVYSLTGSIIEGNDVFHAFCTGSGGIARAFAYSKDLIK